MQEYISNKTLREFGFFVGIGFPVLVGTVLPLFGGHTFRYWTLWIGLPLFYKLSLLYFLSCILDETGLFGWILK